VLVLVCSAKPAMNMPVGEQDCKRPSSKPVSKSKSVSTSINTVPARATRYHVHAINHATVDTMRRTRESAAAMLTLRDLFR
jgi:hypothetical protein